jgi:hypothetical protein
MDPEIQTYKFIIVRNNIILIGLLLSTFTAVKAQTLVFGGFASFAISDSASANSGGAIVWQDSRTRCIMVQGGHIYGQSELYNAAGNFRENCIETPEVSDLRLYPNPGFGQYWLEGSGISGLEIYDNTGRFISNQHVVLSENQRINISLAGQSEGNYFVKVTGAEGLNRVFSIINLKS